MPERHPQTRATIQRAQRDDRVEQQRAVEQGQAGQVLEHRPDRLAVSFGGFDRDDAEGVVDQVLNDVEREDETGGEAQARLEQANIH